MAEKVTRPPHPLGTRNQCVTDLAGANCPEGRRQKPDLSKEAAALLPSAGSAHQVRLEPRLTAS